MKSMTNERDSNLNKMVSAANESVEAFEKSMSVQLEMLNKLKSQMTDEDKKQFNFLVKEMSKKMGTGQIDALNELTEEWDLK